MSDVNSDWFSLGFFYEIYPVAVHSVAGPTGETWWRWRKISRNGRVVAHGEAYVSKSNVIRALMTNMGAWRSQIREVGR
jgi:hypothetical protein